MITIIDAVMDYLNNHFHKKDEHGNLVAERGQFSIAANALSPVVGTYIPGQRIHVIGSMLNDGVYEVDGMGGQTVHVRHERLGRESETFDGVIVAMVIPPGFLDLVKEIEQYQADAANNAGVISESIGSYSRTVATGKNGMPATWIEMFGVRLRKYRRMFPEVV